MFLLHFFTFLSVSLAKYACFDSVDGVKCDRLNENSQNKYLKYTPNESKDLFNEQVTSLNIAIFTKLEPIKIPDNYELIDFSIISNNEVVELTTEKQSLTLKKLNVQNVTIKIETNQNGLNTLNITDSFNRNYSHFFSIKNNKKLRLVMPSCDSFDLLQNFDEFEIDSYQLQKHKISNFILPSITKDYHSNLSIKIISNMHFLTNDFSLVLFSSAEGSLFVNSKKYKFQNIHNSNFLGINTSLPITYVHNCSDLLNIYIQKDYCDLSSINNSFGLLLKFFAGKACFHSECNSNFYLNRPQLSDFLINSAFYNDSSCQLDVDSSSFLPLSIISNNDLNIKLKQINTTILGYLFLNDGNISVNSESSQNGMNYQFYCSSIVNFSEKYFNNNNKHLYSRFDLTETEFFESVTHLELTKFVFLNENIIFIPTFLINIKCIIGGTTLANLISEECSGIDFHPQTNLKLKENGTIVIPYHVNFNETYENVMKIHRRRYNELAEKGENKTFNLDDFYNSFKYYYLKYLSVFNDFTNVFIKTYNQFYPPSLMKDQNSFNSDSMISIVQNQNNEFNHYVRLFVKRDDSPINAFYDTKYRPLICNLSVFNESSSLFENYEIEFSNSLASEFAKVGEFVLDGETNFNSISSCIEYRVKKPPTSSAEFFTYLIDNDLIDSVKHIPFISIITPINSDNFFNLLRNKNSRNIVIVVCENMKGKLNFTQFRQDANIFIVGLSIGHSSDLLDFFNTIRKGSNLKNDLKRALDKISLKIPEILPTVQVCITKSQSLTAVGVTIVKSLIECGSIMFSLCTFNGPTFVCASNLITDLYSIQNLLNITQNYRFLNVTLVPNFIGNRGGTTDLLSITKIEFDENGWFFFSKGTIYDNVGTFSTSSEKVRTQLSSSCNFGIPYVIAENEFSVYSITDHIEFSLIQTKVPPKSLHFFSGEKLSKNLMKEKISLLSESEKIIEIPETTTLSFTGDWENSPHVDGTFSVEFGDSNAAIEKVPRSLNILFGGNKNISIDCNGRNHKINDLEGSGVISIEAKNGDISIDSLSFKPFEKSIID